jgi:hypothetical protein
LGFISAMTTKAVIAAIGTKLFLAKTIIAYAVTYSVTYIATGSGKAPSEPDKKPAPKLPPILSCTIPPANP